jgi:hypothetical protein
MALRLSRVGVTGRFVQETKKRIMKTNAINRDINQSFV